MHVEAKNAWLQRVWMSNGEGISSVGDAERRFARRSMALAQITMGFEQCMIVGHAERRFACRMLINGSGHCASYGMNHESDSCHARQYMRGDDIFARKRILILGISAFCVNCWTIRQRRMGHSLGVKTNVHFLIGHGPIFLFVISVIIAREIRAHHRRTASGYGG